MSNHHKSTAAKVPPDNEQTSERDRDTLNKTAKMPIWWTPGLKKAAENYWEEYGKAIEKDMKRLGMERVESVKNKADITTHTDLT